MIIAKNLVNVFHCLVHQMFIECVLGACLEGFGGVHCSNSDNIQLYQGGPAFHITIISLERASI